MMKFRNTLHCLWVIFLFACCEADSSESSAEITSRLGKNGYIFTCPTTITINRTNEVQFQRFGDLKAGTLNITLMKHDFSSTDDTLIAKKSFEITEGEEFARFYILLGKYNYSYHFGKVLIDGSFDDYHIHGEDTIHFRTPNSNFGIVKTDKPKYRKGETVKARFYMHDQDVDPSENINADIWVKNPNGSKLYQWKDDNMQKGVKEYEYNLDLEAVPGEWKIAAVIKGETLAMYADTHFEVINEELPIFDVTIEEPSYTLIDDEAISISICAKYFYKNYDVKGYVKLNVSFETYDWENQSVPVLEHTQYMDGCLDYKIIVSEIEKNDSSNYYRRLKISVNFTELDTGVKRNKTVFIQRTTVPLNLKFIQDDIAQYFKPGLPYNGMLSVTYPDETPAVNEVICVCSKISREKFLPRWKAERKVQFCKNYTSDEGGLIEFILPPQSTDVVAITLEALLVQYSSDERDTYRTNMLVTPQAFMSLTPWYSPSGSYIQLQSIEKELFPDTEQSFKLLFTSDEEETVFKFYYQVVHEGKVVHMGSVEKAFSLDDDVSSQLSDEEKLLDGPETVLVPQSEKFIKEDPMTSEERLAPFIGDLTINLEINPNWFPSFHLLVYYVRDDKEVVADSKKIKSVKCFKNQNEIQLADDVSQSASKTFILENVSPNDKCEIKIGENIFSLFSGNTKDQSFQILPSFYYGSHYHTQPHCHEKDPQPGFAGQGASSVRKVFAPSYSPYADSLTAIEKTGCLAISDMVILTRPCRDISNIYYTK